MYYHASQTAGIHCLEPRVSNQGQPLVYFSSRRENVLVYCSNAVEKYCRETGFSHTGKWAKWGPYGFTKAGILRLEEYYPNALEETYKGVSAFIYSVDAQEEIKALEDIPNAFVSQTPVPVTSCEYVEDAYSEIMRCYRNGEIAIRRYEDMTQAETQWVYETITNEYHTHPEQEDYRHFLWGKFPFLHEKFHP